MKKYKIIQVGEIAYLYIQDMPSIKRIIPKKKNIFTSPQKSIRMLIITGNDEFIKKLEKEKYSIKRIDTFPNIKSLNELESENIIKTPQYNICKLLKKVTDTPHIYKNAIKSDDGNYYVYSFLISKKFKGFINENLELI